MKIAIHSVFIAKENILFLEEWIKYHQLIGVTDFYLYDNSKVNKITGWDVRHKDKIILGKINKYNIDYDKLVKMNNNQVTEHLKKLCDKYKCINIIEWSPRDKEGNILYNQEEAHAHCLKRLKEDKIDWCANIDMDEYIILKKHDNLKEYILSLASNVKAIRMTQRRFESRFLNVDKLITDISNCTDKNALDRAHKHIYNVEYTKNIAVHEIKIDHKYNAQLGKENEILFNHYKTRYNDNYINENNIPIKIRNQINISDFIPLKSYIH